MSDKLFRILKKSESDDPKPLELYSTSIEDEVAEAAGFAQNPGRSWDDLVARQADSESRMGAFSTQDRNADSPLSEDFKREQERQQMVIKFAEENGFNVKAASRPGIGLELYNAHAPGAYAKGIPVPPFNTDISVYSLAKAFLDRKKIPIPKMPVPKMKKLSSLASLPEEGAAAEPSAPPWEPDAGVDEPSAPPLEHDAGVDEPSAPPLEPGATADDFDPNEMDKALKASAEEVKDTPIITKIKKIFTINQIPDEIIPYLLKYREKVKPTPNVGELMTDVYMGSRQLHELTGHELDNETIFDALITAKGDVNLAAYNLTKEKEGGKRKRKTRVRNTKGQKTRVRNTKGQKTRVRNTKGRKTIKRKMTKRNRR